MTIRIDGTNTTASPGITGGDTDTGLVYGTDEVKIVTGGTDRVKVDSSGNLGVGTSSPGDYLASAHQLVIADSAASTGITIATPASSSGTIAFADGTGAAANSRGVVQYSHSSNSMKFMTNAADAVLIDSSGNLNLTGSTDQRVRLNTSGAGGNDSVHIRGDGNALKYNCALGATGVHIFENGGTERLRIQSGGGISFNGDTAAANALDDYEEGSWTPVLSVVSGTDPSYTLANNYSTYTRIGRAVFFSCDFYCTFSSVGSGGNLLISMPFTPADGANNYVYSGGGQGRASTAFNLYQYEISWYYYNEGMRLYKQEANGVESSMGTSNLITGGTKRICLGGWYHAA